MYQLLLINCSLLREEKKNNECLASASFGLGIALIGSRNGKTCRNSILLRGKTLKIESGSAFSTCSHMLSAVEKQLLIIPTLFDVRHLLLLWSCIQVRTLLYLAYSITVEIGKDPPSSLAPGQNASFYIACGESFTHLQEFVLYEFDTVNTTPCPSLHSIALHHVRKGNCFEPMWQWDRLLYSTIDYCSLAGKNFCTAWSVLVTQYLVLVDSVLQYHVQ